MHGTAARMVAVTTCACVAGACAAVLSGRSQLLPAVLAAVGVFVLVRAAWSRPDLAILALLLIVPLQQPILGWLLSIGMPVPTLRVAGLWKEVVLIAATAAVFVGRPRVLDRLDQAAVAFGGLVALYVVIPIGPPLATRVQGARTDAMFVLVFLIARRVTGGEFANRLERIVLIVAAVLAAGCVWNYFAPVSWEAWARGVRLTDYYAVILESTSAPPVLRLASGQIRAGSFLLNANVVAYLLVIAIGIAVARLATRTWRPVHLAVGALALLALPLTGTRSAFACVPLIVLLAIVGGAPMSRIVVICLVAAVSIAPLASGAGVTDQIRSGLDTSSPRTRQHIDQVRLSIDRIASTPQGSGLGTAGPVSNRFAVPGGIVNESWYLQIGNEVGILGMVLFLVLLICTLAALRRAEAQADTHALVALCALGGVAAGGLVLHTFADFGTAWTVWALAGSSLPVAVSVRKDRGPTHSGVRADNWLVSHGELGR